MAPLAAYPQYHVTVGDWRQEGNTSCPRPLRHTTLPCPLIPLPPSPPLRLYPTRVKYFCPRSTNHGTVERIDSLRKHKTYPDPRPPCPGLARWRRFTPVPAELVQGRRYRLRPGDKEEEQKLNLTFRMMLGVRVAVGRQADRIELETLQEPDFVQACMEAGAVQRWQGGGGGSHMLLA